MMRSSLWNSLKADLLRFSEEEAGVRGMIRGCLSQGFQAIVVYRVFRWCFERNLPTQPIRFIVERTIETLTGISIPAKANIGAGLRIHHFGGIIIHPDTIMGNGCTLYHGTTVGDRGNSGGAPRIGNRVTIGTGAKLLGPIEVGDDVVVGANAVVLASVPSMSIAVGVPAVVKSRLKPPCPEEIKTSSTGRQFVS